MCSVGARMKREGLWAMGHLSLTGCKQLHRINASNCCMNVILGPNLVIGHHCKLYLVIKVST